MTLEDLELILAPMVEDGKEAVGSMGDDTPLAVLSTSTAPISHFFRQNFSQVTNPPIDSSARTAGDEPEDAVRQPRQHPGRDARSQTRDPVLESPVLANAEFEAMVRVHGQVAEIDCTCRSPKRGSMDLRQGLERIRAEAEDAVRSRRRGTGPDRRTAGAGPRRDADDPGHRRRALAG
jgi:hypothetical protein